VGACVAIAIVCGLFFRFYHVERKVFWDDEIFSAMRIVGDREESVIKAAAEARTAADLQAILHPGPLRAKNSVFATVDGLINEEPQHPPIYFVLAHLWSDPFGDSLKALRMFSAVVSVLALPAMFWLCFELFGSARAGWIGVALIATSPVAVLYAQELRDYGLWTVALLLLGASLLRAMRLQTPRAWALHAAMLAFSLYVYVLSLVTALGLAVFVALDSRKQRRPAFGWLSFAAGFALFLPWLAIIVTRFDQVSRGTATIFAQRSSAAYTLQKLAGSLRLNFFDYNLQATRLNLALSILVLALVAYALYFLWRTTPFRTWGFVFALLTSATVPIVAHDLLFSGMLTAQTRYFIPAFLAADLALVGLFGAVLASASFGRTARIWSAVFALVLLGRISSCAVSSQATSWWNDFDERSIAVAQTINASAKPLFVSDNYISYVLSVAEYLRPDIPVSVRASCYLCSMKSVTVVGADFGEQLRRSSDVYLLGPSQVLQARVEGSLERSRGRARYWCIDIRKNCAGELRLWRWVE
jgi:uncharacterized membrane protein